MRFSLATLVLVVLWIGAATTVWFWREPWQQGLFPPRESYKSLHSLERVSPDQTRKAIADNVGLIIQDNDGTNFVSQSPVLWRANYGVIPVGFIDDDCLIGDQAGEPAMRNSQYRCYHRRFPEWWWGHFYRPEVWLFAALSGLLIWRFVATRKTSGRDARAP